MLNHNCIVGNESGKMAIPEFWIYGMFQAKLAPFLRTLLLLRLVVCSTLSRERSPRNWLHNRSIQFERLPRVLPRQSAHLHPQGVQRDLLRSNLLHGIHSRHQSLGCQVLTVEWIWHQRGGFSLCGGICEDDLPSTVPSRGSTSRKYACSISFQSSFFE